MIQSDATCFWLGPTWPLNQYSIFCVLLCQKRLWLHLDARSRVNPTSETVSFPPYKKLRRKLLLTLWGNIFVNIGLSNMEHSAFSCILKGEEFKLCVDVFVSPNPLQMHVTRLLHFLDQPRDPEIPSCAAFSYRNFAHATGSTADKV